MRAREREPTKKQIFKTMGEGIGEGGGDERTTMQT